MPTGPLYLASLNSRRHQTQNMPSVESSPWKACLEVVLGDDLLVFLRLVFVHIPVALVVVAMRGDDAADADLRDEARRV